MVLQAGLDSALTGLLVERMNDLRSGANTTVEEQNAFNRAVTLLLQFREGGMASWAEQSGNAKQYELILSNYSPAHITDVEEVLRLLDLRGDPARETQSGFRWLWVCGTGSSTVWPYRLGRSR